MMLLTIQRDFKKAFPDSIIIFNKKFKEGFSVHEYGEVLAESKIVFSPKGFDSSECFRLYEAMRAGCIVISERLPDIEFYKDSPIIQIDDWEEGLTIAKRLLLNPYEMERLQEEITKWWEERCSEEAMAKFVFNKIKLLNGLQ